MDATTKIILYGDYLSQPSRAVYFFCTLNKIPFEFRYIHICKKEHLSNDYVKINNLHQVPTLIDGDLILLESHTILRYLSEKFNLDQYYNSKDIIERCKVDMYLDWHHLGLRRLSGGLYYYKIMTKKLGKPTNESCIIEYENNIPNVFKTIENQFLKQGNQKYIAGSKPTIADISCLCELKQLELLNYTYEKYPILYDWIKRMESLNGYKESHGHLKEIHENLLKSLE